MILLAVYPLAKGEDSKKLIDLPPLVRNSGFFCDIYSKHATKISDIAFMEVLQHNASYVPGIISVPNTATEPIFPQFIIVVVSDVRTFMEQESIASAQVIYFDTYEAALKFREELYAHYEPTIAKEIESKRGAK